jgi:hypothetical protein
MVRVAQEDLRADVLEIAVRECFDRTLSAHGHEGRRLDVAVRGSHHAAPRAAIGVRDAELEDLVSHDGRPAVYNRRSRAAPHRARASGGGRSIDRRLSNNSIARSLHD